MCDNRENIFTQLARDINDFSSHNINKVELYERVISYIEIADDEERTERNRHKENVDEYYKNNIYPLDDTPYSNYEFGLNILKK